MSTAVPGIFPIQRLQPEILAKIFTFCLSTNNVGINHAPLLLCNICSSWRALAMSTPPLWTNLDLRLKPLVDSNISSIIHGIHTWLGRSGILPLTIRLCCSESETCFEKVLQVCDALSKYVSRWESMDLAVPNTLFAPWPNLRAVPLLRTLRAHSPLNVPFTSAPCLARVHLFTLRPTVIPHIPWHQLVELAITEWESSNTVLQLIAWCPLLDSISVRVSEYHTRTPVRSIPSVEHSVLRNIKFCFFHDQYTILESLVVPGLKSLSLCDDTFLENRTPQICSNPLGLMNRSHCELRELHLVRCYFSQHGLIELLEHRSCQTLTSLRIKNYNRSQNVSDKLLLRLTHVYGKAADVLCPELTHLTLTYCYRGNTSAGVLGRMILSRSEKNQLGSFELFIATHPEFAEMDHMLLRRAGENGLKLCINNFNRWTCLGANNKSRWT